MVTFFSSLRRFFYSLRSPRSESIVSFVDDPLKVRREIRFLLLRWGVFTGIAIVIVAVSAARTDFLSSRLIERYAMLRQVYNRFETVARLTHNVSAGREALVKINEFIPIEEQMLGFIKSLEKLAEKTENTAIFRFDQSIAVAASNLQDLHVISWTISLKGNTRSFLRYLEKFYGLPYPVVLDNIELQGEGGINKKNTAMSLRGRVYIR